MADGALTLAYARQAAVGLPPLGPLARLPLPDPSFSCSSIVVNGASATPITAAAAAPARRARRSSISTSSPATDRLRALAPPSTPAHGRAFANALFAPPSARTAAGASRIEPVGAVEELGRSARKVGEKAKEVVRRPSRWAVDEQCVPLASLSLLLLAQRGPASRRQTDVDPFSLS